MLFETEKNHLLWDKTGGKTFRRFTSLKFEIGDERNRQNNNNNNNNNNSNSNNNKIKRELSLFPLALFLLTSKAEVS